MIVKPLHLVVALFILFGAFWALEVKQSNSLESFASSLDRQKTEAILDGCRRGNLRSAYELANHSDGSERSRLVREVLPIVNCPRTTTTGHLILVTKTVQDQYVRIVVEKHLWPQVGYNGEIARVGPLPAKFQKP